jgi:hypothetical protein
MINIFSYFAATYRISHFVQRMIFHKFFKMISERTFSHNRPLFLAAILFLTFLQSAISQEQKHQNGISSTWLILQALPSYSWTSFPQRTNFAFEWEAAPVLYSFGMNKLDPRWHSFHATQPQRFAGSIELIVSTQLYTSKVGTSHWGFSGQILTHLPLVEYGEYLGLNFGVARYTISGISSNYIIGGFSSIFSFLHYNIKYSPSDKIWMNTIEFRFF